MSLSEHLECALLEQMVKAEKKQLTKQDHSTFKTIYKKLKDQGLVKDEKVTNVLFDYALLSGNTSVCSKYLDQMINMEYVIINSFSAERLFYKALKNDDFNCLALLLHYAEKNGKNIGNWDLSEFRYALEFHLNDHTNVSNILMFMKYYVYYYKCRISSSGVDTSKLNDLKKDELFALHKEIFPH
jgi:hypothetical protein